MRMQTNQGIDPRAKDEASRTWSAARAAARRGAVLSLAALLALGQAPQLVWASAPDAAPVEAASDGVDPVGTAPAGSTAGEPESSSGTGAQASVGGGAGAEDAASGSNAADTGAQASASTPEHETAVGGVQGFAPGGPGGQDAAPADGAPAAAPDADGDAASELVAEVSVGFSVIGVDADGADEVWVPAATHAVEESSTADTLIEAVLDEAGLVHESAYESGGYSLNTITAPDGRVLGWDAETGKYWQLFVDGEASSVGAGEVELEEGAQLVLYYSAWGDELPDLDTGDEGAEDSEGEAGDTGGGDAGIVPDAPRPDYDAAWPSFGGTASGAVTTAPTPTDDAELSWSFSYAPEQGSGFYSSSADTLIVDGDVFLINTAGVLMRVDGDTGALVAQASTGFTGMYFYRLAYGDGLIIVPSDTGALAAYTADTLTCVWRSDSIDDGERYQALSSLTVANGCVYAGFTVPGGWSDPGVTAVLRCVSLEDGHIVWSRKSTKEAAGESVGYYWAGAAVSGDDLVIGNDGGRVSLVDGATGETLGSVSIGAPCRAGIVASDTEPDTYFAVARDTGTLYKIVREGDALTIAGSVQFTAWSTSTPAIAGGKAYVGGNDASYKGTLSVIDLASMTVDYTVTGLPAAVQSAPLVSTQGSGTYVYFTCNTRPGGMYCYRVGDETAKLVFTPSDSAQNFTTASVVADAAGNLYLTNDSGTLFKLAAATLTEVPGIDEGGQAPGDTGSDADGGASSGAGAPGATGAGPAGSGVRVLPSMRPLSTAVAAIDAAASADGSRSEAAGDVSESQAVPLAAAAGARSSAAQAASAGEQGEINRMAVVGIAVGVIGLAAVGAYLGFSGLGKAGR